MKEMRGGIYLADGWPHRMSLFGSMLIFSLSAAGLVAYIAWLYFARRTHILLIEMAFIVSDGGEIVDKIRAARQAHSERTPGQRWAFLSDVARGLRWCRYRTGGLWVREEHNSYQALGADAVTLVQRHRTLFEGPEDANGKRCVVGLVYTAEMPDRLGSGGLDDAKKHLDFLLQEGPLELGFVEAYYGVLGDDDVDERLIEDLREIHLRHRPTPLDHL
ncbi:MAG TPA: hypothetical protein VHE55_18545 [Fimbriimonadaceae bacterium]|nr:hypothetical protein [Fimbriimonadaceae bacterium]